MLLNRLPRALAAIDLAGSWQAPQRTLAASSAAAAAAMPAAAAAPEGVVNPSHLPPAARDGWPRAFQTAAAGLLSASAAAALLLSLESHCEARPPAGSVTPERIQAAVRELWQHLEEQLHRVEASLPSGVQLPGIPEPEVTVAGGGATVVFKLPQQLDIPGLITTLRRRLRSPRFQSLQDGAAGSSVSEESSSGREGRARRFVRRSAALGDLEVDVMEPHDPQQPAVIEFRGLPTEGELVLMTAVLSSTMQVRRRGGFQELEDFGSLFEGTPFGRGFETLDPFLGHLKEFMEGFAQLEGESAWGLGRGEGAEEEAPRDTQPTPLARPKRFDELGPREREAPPLPSAEERKEAAARRQLEAATKKLQGLGAQVFPPGKKEEVDWGILAGYDEQKRAIEDTLLLALLHPDVYNEIAKGTRQHYSPNRPRAVLFEGPPGTGKTTSARVIATQAAVPLAYIPLESIVSKWYGESERMLADMLKTCESLPEGCIVFLDELDALATSRGSDMHEATRRLLGVLLRHLDGFDTSKRTVVIGATNRKQDLDPALLSRFDTSITFGLPSEACRAQILGKYARHLSKVELGTLARATPGMAGRDLRDSCEQAERRWASLIIRGQASKGELPPLDLYLEAAKQRLREQAAGGNDFSPRGIDST